MGLIGETTTPDLDLHDYCGKNLSIACHSAQISIVNGQLVPLPNVVFRAASPVLLGVVLRYTRLQYCVIPAFLLELTRNLSLGMSSSQSSGLPPNYDVWLPQHELPVAHRVSTVYGLLITFQILVWVAVTFRLYCRTVSTRSFGWDDFFVICALVTTTVSTSLTAVSA